MSLSKINTPQIEAYSALTALIKDLQHLIKNPPDLKQPVEESLALIEKAKSDQMALDKARADAKTEENTSKATLRAQEVELNEHAKDLADLKKSLDDKHNEVKAHAKHAEDRHMSLNTREGAVAVREASVTKREAEVKSAKEDIASREFDLEERSKSITAREDKLRQALR